MPDRFGKADADSLRPRDALADKHLGDARRFASIRDFAQLPTSSTPDQSENLVQPASPVPTKSVIARYKTRHRRSVTHEFTGVSDGTHLVSAHDMSAARNDGFTLIELLLVVGLIAVLAAATAPSIAGGMRRFTLTIREPAGRQHHPNSPLPSGWSGIRPSGCDSTIPASGQYQILDGSDADVMVRRRFLLEGAAFSSVSGDIEIDSQGRVTALAGTMPATIVLAGPDADTRTITVSRSGRVELP